MTSRTRIILIIAVALALFTSTKNALAAQQTEAERQIRMITPPIGIVEEKIPPKDTWFFDCYYEPSTVMQGNKFGRWSEITNSFGYTRKDITGYLMISEFDRLGINDRTANFGCYFNLKDSYFHFEDGFGWDVDYMYQFQSIVEYGHKLFKNIFGQIGYNYRMYPSAGDTHNIYPGLIYYFGDSYMNANYGISCIESRNTSGYGLFRGDFAITSSLHFFTGVAFGQRLYDIYGFSGGKEKGYIVFGGITLKLYKGITCKFGGSYGKEDPKFVKRSLSFDLNVKF